MNVLGYGNQLLGVPIAPPRPAGDDSADARSDAGSDLGGSIVDANAEVLDYTHFTVGMHPTRRPAWWVAWNVDGLTLFPSDSISRSGESPWV